MRYRRWPTTPTVLLLGVALLGVIRGLTLKETLPPLPTLDALHHVSRVVDGDTLLLDSGHCIQLLGVDCPEAGTLDQPVAPWEGEATRFTQQLVESRPILLEFDRERRDDYQRILAYVYVDDVLLNEAVILAGFGRATTSVPMRRDIQACLVAAEEAARQQRRGLWSEPDLRRARR